MPTNDLPISVELVQKRAYLPCKLAELSYKNPEYALQLLRAWGDGKKPITTLWEETIKAINQ